MTIEPQPPSLDVLERMIGNIQTIQHQLEATIPSPGPQPEGWEDPIFDPKLHLAPSEPPASRYTFSDLKIPPPTSSSSPVAGTSHFPLFAPSSIPLIRRSLLNPRYINKTACIFGAKTLILRNTAAHSPFFRRLWTHPEVLRTLSDAAGVELEPVMETMELGHANVQVDFSKYEQFASKEEKLRAVAEDLTSDEYMRMRTGKRGTTSVKTRSEEEVEDELRNGGATALLPWHYDSYPWVCVGMISDTTDMVGGETVIQRGDGRFVGISQPGIGSAMLLQGGLIKHLALPSRSSTCSDRITIITSFRPRATHIYDSSFMSNIRVYSDLPVLYLQWLSYRLQRLLPNLQRLQDKRRFLVTYDEQDLLDEEREMYVLKEYAKRTLRQMVAPGVVEALVGRFGMTVFYTLRDDYVSGRLFEGKERKVCQSCNIGGAMVDKRHMAICPGGRKWRPESPLWEDLEDTRMVLQNWGGVEMETRIRELQVKDVMVKWRKEGREWGIADEMAVQGLGEYLLEFLEMYGVEF